MGDRSLVYGVARDLAKEHMEKMNGLLEWQKVHCDVRQSEYLEATYVYRDLNVAIRRKVRKMKAETLGQIAFYAPDNLVKVRGQSLLFENDISGRELLREIVIAAIAGEMTRIFNLKPEYTILTR